MSQYLKYIQTIFKSDLFFPLVLVIAYIGFLFIVRGIIPSGAEIINSFASLYHKYGYEIIFVAAFLESLVLVNLFVPGQVAMALGAVFARTGQTELPLVILVAGLGAFSGYCLDYILGYFGFSDVIKKMGYSDFLTLAKSNLRKFGKRGLILGFIHSNLGSFLSLTAGTINFNWKIFLTIAILATFVWTSFWGILVYSLGEVFLDIFKRFSFLLIGLAAGLMLLLRLGKNDK
ncbi:MAG: hypothetical protein ACD_30C00087G0011 [uncultured bacterium]|uniref:VTT domain-containing protein n=3 Tax=Candidatus Daviesiibacteriota TaxID=1752718 RepID=A0A0G0HEC6_9BACT|nr:MAG: hypothetical protein ACD_30C00087G0011 [uncultured bacterium]KKQ10469.1 MAG: hypothetical protein US19_C0004G0017 [Candidatus Daviesbacteria bacterium GW2011_GWB1_36_5]KKQ16201.1 MAG: hypothetical protein US28_C0004G0043 [Candidatus Daviesbacteria bacterium GW2011_GWA1_36_8]OGE33274.1 MAG: hypothetical protein A3C99_01520 [Candidatus Daviesbacteria bacterium RIFCSPHIGHO2_02_FULL_37_9]OGE36176.1 MAG: hypothetical protein A3E66_05205 [Candidatus Daviesbacteria bacterium RIFCSPHIGHO2_12_FU